MKYTVFTYGNCPPSMFRGIWAGALMLLFSIFTAEAAIRSNSMSIPFANASPEKVFKKASEFQKSEVLDSALIYYSWLVETHRESDNKQTRLLVGKSLSEMGQLYYTRFSDYLSAYRCLEEAETIFRETDDKASYAVVLLNMGNLFNMYDYIFPSGKRKDSARARKFYDRTIEVASKIADWNLVCSAYINRIMLDLPFKTDHKQNDLMKRLLSDSIPSSTIDYQLTRLLCDGTAAMSDNEDDKALNIFLRMKDSIGLTAPRERYMANLCLSSVYLKQGKYGHAIEAVRSMISPNSGINDIDVQMEAFDLLSHFYELAQKPDSASLYHIKYHEAKDSLTKDLVELEPTRLGIELDRMKDHARVLDAEKKTTYIILVCAAILLIILSAVAIIIFRKNRELRMKNKVIFNQTQSLLSEPTGSTSSEARDESGNKDKTEREQEKKPEKYRDSSMTDETRQSLIVKISKALANIDEICDKNFSLQRLTAIVGSNTSYISRAINEHYGMTFGNLLNKLRVEEACRRMANIEKYGHLTIDAISEGVGFNTRATFTKAFKIHIGMLPSEYAKLLKNNKE
ncbi:MAG: helix-turn-helix domain-containing protein [Muribaculaceae bacterium]|nr:helix-turn-helix domain-containing protein [Muribaculaceae bacterium]